MTTVLITGGAGFIGSHLVEHILSQTDWQVVIVDSLTYAANTAWLEGVKVNPRVRFIEMDIATPNLSVLDGVHPDYIVHMAAETHVDNSIKDPEPFVASNIIGTYNLLQWLRTQPEVKKFLYFSTDEVFGDAEREPFTEWSRYSSRNPYSATKAAAEELCLAWQNTYGLPIIISHCSNVFGERQNREKFIPILVDRISKDGVVTIHTSQEGEPGDRTYVYAKDVSEAVMLMLEKGQPRQKFNIPGLKVSNAVMAGYVSNILDKPYKAKFTYPYGQRPGWDFSYSIEGNELAKLGWKKPSFASFWENLDRTVKSYAPVESYAL